MTFPGGATTQIELVNPTSANWDAFIRENAELAGPSAARRRVIPVGKSTGETVTICGAGPSLAAEDWRLHLDIAEAHGGQVWACNSALTWLYEQGGKPTHGFAIDQTEHMVEEWRSAPPSKYLLATSVNPKLTRHLQGCGRQIIWFHNYVGSATELDLYRDPTMWSGTVMVGDGLNAVNRAVCLAKWMRFKEIVVLGADCALGAGDVMHANGDGATASGATPVILDGVIGGRLWRTKPDMLFSAVALAKMAGQYGRRFKLIGDTLPKALLAESARYGTRWDEWLDWVCCLSKMRNAPRVPGVKATPQGRVLLSRMFGFRGPAPAQPVEVPAVAA